jgi:hypothetical protein
MLSHKLLDISVCYLSLLDVSVCFLRNCCTSLYVISLTTRCHCLLLRKLLGVLCYLGKYWMPFYLSNELLHLFFCVVFLYVYWEVQASIRNPLRYERHGQTLVASPYFSITDWTLIYMQPSPPNNDKYYNMKFSCSVIYSYIRLAPILWDRLQYHLLLIKSLTCSGCLNLQLTIN